MTNKIKVIDLLNKYYNNEIVPSHIRYKYCDYELGENTFDYVNKDGLWLFQYFLENENDWLNIDLEIIEEIEKPKEIEPLNLSKYCEVFTPKDVSFENKINELVKEINLLKKEEKINE